MGLLYAWTGSLNMAAVGRGLASHPPGTTFVAVAFVFVTAGFLVKMAAVPFQFWLADAHAVAPTPVCVLFSGVMVELGLYAVARLYWTVFATSIGGPAVRDLFLVMGCVTALTGAVYCFGQRHLKRMLAFSTVSHVGLMIVGFALLDADALGGTAVYLVGHAMVKGTLFLCAGILLHRCGSVDEYDLRNGGRNLWPVGVMMAVASLGLLGVPPFATFFGQSQIHAAAVRLHLDGIAPVPLAAEAITAAALLRFTARVFLGWGRVHEATSRGQPAHPHGHRDGRPARPHAADHVAAGSRAARRGGHGGHPRIVPGRGGGLGRALHPHGRAGGRHAGRGHRTGSSRARRRRRASTGRRRSSACSWPSVWPGWPCSLGCSAVGRTGPSAAGSWRPCGRCGGCRAATSAITSPGSRSAWRRTRGCCWCCSDARADSGPRHGPAPLRLWLWPQPIRSPVPCPACSTRSPSATCACPTAC